MRPDFCFCSFIMLSLSIPKRLAHALSLRAINSCSGIEGKATARLSHFANIKMLLCHASLLSKHLLFTKRRIYPSTQIL